MEQSYAEGGRPPVFLRSEAWRNLIFNPEADLQEIGRLRALIPDVKRHKHFGSMNSSQALEQSVLGNLAIHNHLDCLSELMTDEGEPLFGKAKVAADNFTMEYQVTNLGEPRRTSLDGFISGEYQVAIECKFTEKDVGPCSRPRLTPEEPNYRTDYCDGNYTEKEDRKGRCPLTRRGIKYWRFIPSLFKWQNDTDLTPCPVNFTYQLVRNILAIGVHPDGTISQNDGHALLVYDSRNPAFQAEGLGYLAYIETREALLFPTMLRKCSWQTIIHHLRRKNILPWLTEHLSLKYGL